MRQDAHEAVHNVHRRTNATCRRRPSSSFQETDDHALRIVQSLTTMRAASDFGFRQAPPHASHPGYDENQNGGYDSAILNRTSSDMNEASLTESIEDMSRQQTKKASNGMNSSPNRTRSAYSETLFDESRHQRSLQDRLSAAAAYFTTSGDEDLEEIDRDERDRKHPLVVSLVSFLLCDDNGCSYSDNVTSKKKGYRYHVDDSSVIEEIFSVDDYGTEDKDEVEDYSDMLDRMLFRTANSLEENESDEDSLVETEYTTDYSVETEETSESSYFTAPNYIPIRSNKASRKNNKKKKPTSRMSGPPKKTLNKGKSKKEKTRESKPPKRSKYNPKKPCYSVRYDF